MLRKTLIALSLAALPLTALALDFSSAHLPYPDVQKGQPDAAAVSLLTEAGVVEGYPDGTFRPEQTLNRAEFLKIVLLIKFPELPDVKINTSGCFPDVAADAWFARYVCFAKNRSIVGGYPDGTFRPSQTVNYAEALKILVELYGYEGLPASSDPWYDRYFQAAKTHDTALRGFTNFAAGLSRGNMARLAAAFLSESQGQLKEYRSAELGIDPSASSSSRSSSSSSTRASSSASAASSASGSLSSSAASSSLSSSSSASVSALFTLPARSHFLLVGRTSDAIANGIVRSTGEPSKVLSAQIKLFAEALTLDSIDIVTIDGKLIASLKRRQTSDTSDYQQTFEVLSINPDDRFTIPQDVDFPVIARANIKTIENNGSSNQLIQMRTFTMSLAGVTTNNVQNVAIPSPFPKHQTAFGRITQVKRVSPDTAQLQNATGAIIGAFSFSGSAITGKQVRLEQFVFSLNQNGNIDVRNWRLMRQGDGVTSVPCSIGSDGVTCANFPGPFGILGSATAIYELRADVKILGTLSADALLQVDLRNAGSPSDQGSVRWTDDSGSFQWIEADTPVAVGTKWTK